MERRLTPASERMRRSGFGPGKNGRPPKSPAVATAETVTPPRSRPRRAPPLAPTIELPPLAAPERPLDLAPVIGPRLFDTSAAARYLGVSKGTMRGLALRGVVPSVKFPGVVSLRFDVADLDNLIARSKTTSPSHGRPGGLPMTLRDDTR
jgi:hypothetical protein